MKDILNKILPLGVTVLMLCYILNKFEINKSLSLVTNWQIFYAITSVGIINSVQIILLSERQRIVARISSVFIGWKDSWVTCLLGGLFNNTPISVVGGNLMKVYQITKLDVAWTAAIGVIILDSYIGYIGMMFWVLMSAQFIIPVLKDPIVLNGYWFLLVAGIMVAIAFVALGLLPRGIIKSIQYKRIVEVITVAHYILHNPTRAFHIFIIAVVINLLNIVSILVISIIYQFNISMEAVFAATPIVFLLSMFPIAVAGWGVREGAFVISLGAFGISPDVSVVVSVTFGLAVLVSYLPAMLFIKRSRSSIK
jgi:hypothetical protein